MVVLAAGFLAAVHARVHGHDAGRHFLMTDDLLGAVQLVLQGEHTRRTFVEAVDQTLETLYVQSGEDEGRLGAHGPVRLL
ncbi:hypothetical protein D3C71_1873260 [compost metagenome]